MRLRLAARAPRRSRTRGTARHSAPIASAGALTSDSGGAPSTMPGRRTPAASGSLKRRSTVAGDRPGAAPRAGARPAAAASRRRPASAAASAVSVSLSRASMVSAGLDRRRRRRRPPPSPRASVGLRAASSVAEPRRERRLARAVQLPRRRAAPRAAPASASRLARAAPASAARIIAAARAAPSGPCGCSACAGGGGRGSSPAAPRAAA